MLGLAAIKNKFSKTKLIYYWTHISNYWKRELLLGSNLKMISYRQNKHKIGSLFAMLLVVCFLNSGCAGPKQIVKDDNSTVSNIACNYPFESSNPLALLVFYKDGMHYLTNANESCRQSFAKDLRREVQASSFISEGCTEVTLKDIEDALYHPDELRKRLDY